jgi:AcrR family transcriptional regulator
MSRWEPDARGRLLRAAIDLFTERGYEATTAAQIAERAGLTKTTLFRHFADKREILFQGQDLLITQVTDGVEGTRVGIEPFEMLRGGVLALCTFHTAERRDIGRQLDVILSSSPELRERAIFKRSAITDALQSALTTRLGDAREGAVLADAGIRAYYDGFAAWIAEPGDMPLAEVVSAELDAYREVLSTLSSGQARVLSNAQ